MAGQMKAFWDATGEQIPASCCSGILSMLLCCKVLSWCCSEMLLDLLAWGTPSGSAASSNLPAALFLACKLLNLMPVSVRPELCTALVCRRPLAEGHSGGQARRHVHQHCHTGR